VTWRVFSIGMRSRVFLASLRRVANFAVQRFHARVAETSPPRLTLSCKLSIVNSSSNATATEVRTSAAILRTPNPPHRREAVSPSPRQGNPFPQALRRHASRPLPEGRGPRRPTQPSGRPCSLGFTDDCPAPSPARLGLPRPYLSRPELHVADSSSFRKCSGCFAIRSSSTTAWTSPPAYPERRSSLKWSGSLFLSAQ